MKELIVVAANHKCHHDDDLPGKIKEFENDTVKIKKDIEQAQGIFVEMQKKRDGKKKTLEDLKHNSHGFSALQIDQLI